MSRRFYERYYDCPGFYVGSLINACEVAFSPTVIEERRPVLVYVHHDRSMFSNIFCHRILCSATIIDYLLENYIVWPCDVTLEVNRNMLANIWQEMFHGQLLNEFDEKKYPKLIGIKRIVQEQQNGSLAPDYQPVLLLEYDVLAFYRNIETRFGKKIILEIVKNLTLNDAINAFSNNILPLLSQQETKVEICDPSSLFINTMLQKLTPEQVVSLRLTTSWYRTQEELSRLTRFTNVISLSLLNFQDIRSIEIYRTNFPRLTSLCFWYDNELNFTIFRELLQYLWYSIKRFEVHCPGNFCSHADQDQYNNLLFANYNIEYFLFDLSTFPLPPTSDCTKQLPSCFLMTAIDLIKYMLNLRYFQLITNIDSISKLLDLNEWVRMTSYCSRLTKITLRVLGRMKADDEMSQKIVEIQNALCTLSQNTQFQVIFN
ncbi:unnamed protein product [Rotaria magnacalcarata]|uniref:UAS domain-containing protein n=1 Tax=Rotaria magnacalcarata TaxID=392030 RepID=A0A816RSB6_9BILA|nr:unnamed protein product [Rotaria magnacalcarata]CAF2101713.1 unnamed protein product [Rotaria magnacalcarata]CAF4100680.1 unnamed protein product [Rotaria magnacalcarata]CAF4225269.1 unnamed protein product [Rotaria magnacalcarata]